MDILDHVVCRERGQNGFEHALGGCLEARVWLNCNITHQHSEAVIPDRPEQMFMRTSQVYMQNDHCFAMLEDWDNTRVEGKLLRSKDLDPTAWVYLKGTTECRKTYVI